MPAMDSNISLTIVVTRVKARTEIRERSEEQEKWDQGRLPCSAARPNAALNEEPYMVTAPASTATRVAAITT
jgi:hypothetical protein